MEDFSINLSGLSFAYIWNNIICYVGGFELENGNTLKEQIDLNLQKEKLKKEIDRLEKFARKETQPKKKFDLVSKKRKLEEELKRL